MQILRWIMAAAIVATVGVARSEDSQTVRAMFEKPSAEYSTAPFWVWNDTMTDEEVISTLNDLAGQGIRQVIIHPRPGLMTPYLSQEWFRLWKVALDEAKRLGIRVWIYDENSYPSGFAGGFVPQLMPESRGIGLTIQQVNEPPKWSGDIVGVFQQQGDEFKNITESIKAGEVNGQSVYLVAKIKQADKSGWYANRTYVNLITKGVTEKFLEVTLDAYKQKFGGDFGKQVPGTFTDEPHILPAGQLPWAKDLPEVFQNRWGYSLIDNLPCLIRPVGDWKRVRHNYYATLLELFIDRWARPYYEYCEKNNLEFTGHYWEHDWPNCVKGPDNMAMSAWQHRPGIDILFNQYAENVHSQFGNIRSVKELASVANQLGRKRTLCEAYGGAGWDLRFEDMKRIGDWLIVLGINTINEHISMVSMRGSRKADYPQSFSYHEPWWQGYHVVENYFARLSAALSQGEQINRILVVEPTSTAWFYQFDTSQSGQLDKIGSEFQRLVVTLAKQQVEFDLGSEDIITRHGSVDGNSFKIGKRTYDIVVLPPLMENLNSKTIELLEKYLANHGRIVFKGNAPEYADGQLKPSDKLKAEFQIQSIKSSPDPLLAEYDGFSIKSISDNNSILLHQRRKIDDGEILFAVNTSLSSPCKGVIESSAKGIEEWDAETGAISPYSFEKTEKGIKAAFELAPCGSILLFLSNKPVESAKTLAMKETKIEPAGQMKIKRLSPNVLTLDFVDVVTDQKKFEKSYYNRAAIAVFRENGFSENPWEHGVQFQDEIISEKFEPNSGFEATYSFTIKDKVPDSLFVVIERPQSYTITCNGKEIKAQPGQWWLDKSFGKIDISSIAKTGDNNVTIKASPFSVYDEVASAFIIGDFLLEPADAGFVIAADKATELGPWNKQGCPFYDDSVSYKQKFNVKKPDGRYFVELAKWAGSVAKVSVNGKDSGFIWHQPWRCDVTGQIRKGDNEIEVCVIGSLRNTLGPHHGRPAPGQVSPWLFQNAPSSGPPSGDKYSTISCGLFEPFELVSE